MSEPTESGITICMLVVPNGSERNCVNTGRFISQQLGVITEITTLSDSPIFLRVWWDVVALVSLYSCCISLQVRPPNLLGVKIHKAKQIFIYSMLFFLIYFSNSKSWSIVLVQSTDVVLASGHQHQLFHSQPVAYTSAYQLPADQ